MIKLNSVTNSDLGKVSQSDVKVGEVSRNDIVLSGRACAMEYIGNSVNAARRLLSSNKYESRFDSKQDYNDTSKAHMEKKIMYCATLAYRNVGKDAPENIEQVRGDTSLQKDQTFLRALAGIDSEVISPLFFTAISDIAGEMMQWDSIPFGRTKEINIRSNEAFLFEDSAWGSSRSATTNFMYGDTITLNPTAKTANAQIKWYQMVAAEGGMDAGWYYGAIMQGMYSKIMATFTKSLTTAAADTKYVPSYLRYSSYSSANWANATERCATANGIDRDRLMAFGSYQALQKVLPSGTASDAALTYNLGPEWMRNGFLAMVGGVPLHQVKQAIVPGTVNTTGKTVFPTDEIYIAGRVGDSLAPMYGAFFEGSPITFEYTPMNTADFSINIDVTAYFAIAPVFASKVAVIADVT